MLALLLACYPPAQPDVRGNEPSEEAASPGQPSTPELRSPQAGCKVDISVTQWWPESDAFVESLAFDAQGRLVQETYPLPDDPFQTYTIQTIYEETGYTRRFDYPGVSRDVSVQTVWEYVDGRLRYASEDWDDSPWIEQELIYTYHGDVSREVDLKVNEIFQYTSHEQVDEQGRVLAQEWVRLNETGLWESTVVTAGWSGANQVSRVVSQQVEGSPAIVTQDKWEYTEDRLASWWTYAGEVIAQTPLRACEYQYEVPGLLTEECFLNGDPQTNAMVLDRTTNTHRDPEGRILDISITRGERREGLERQEWSWDCP